MDIPGTHGSDEHQISEEIKTARKMMSDKAATVKPALMALMRTEWDENYDA